MAKKRGRGTRRSQLPQALPGATNFSDERAELDPLAIVRLLKSQPQLCARLVKATSIPTRGNGRSRMKGNWALVYLAFIASKKFADLEPWWSVVGANPALWRECGFKSGRPPDTASPAASIAATRAPSSPSR